MMMAGILRKLRYFWPRRLVEGRRDRPSTVPEPEQRLHSLLEALGDIVVHRDGEGRILYANPVLADVIGCRPNEVLGKTLAELGIDVGVMPKSTHAAGENLSSTDIAVHGKGGTRWYSWTELSLDGHDDIPAATNWAIARDITARKRAETALVNARQRAEQASVAKSRFLATVSHEIRTPMNGITGMATLLTDTRLSHEQRTYVSAISTSATALLAMIEDLLDYSKIEAGRLELEPQLISVRELAESVIELLSTRAFAKNIGLGCHVATDVPETVTADPNRLRQILLNLLGNAIKFTDEGGVLLSVSLVRNRDLPALALKVDDTGPGIDKTVATRIFKEFEQGDDSSTRRHGGAGLGLAITRRLVEAMDGSIAVESAPGEGAAFTAILPIGENGGARPDRVLALKNWDVAIVTPFAVEAEALAMTIRACGGKARVFDGEQSAQALLRRRKPAFDAVIIDASLEGDTADLLKRLRRVGLRAEQALTLIAPSDRGRIAALRGNGYNAFLARPVRGDTLLRMLLKGSQPAAIEGEANDTDDVAAIGGGRKGGLRVLIAEDNEVNATLAHAALTRAGHSVTVVSNGRAALDALSRPSREHDLVLMDLHMPLMDGLDAIAGVRRYEEETGLAAIPILVLSADGQEKTRHDVLAHGASGFITKPLDPDRLLAALDIHAAS